MKLTVAERMGGWAKEPAKEETSGAERRRDTRAALVEHFREGHFVHAAAHFAPDEREIADLLKRGEQMDEETDRRDQYPGGAEPDVDAGDGPTEDPTDELDVAASDETTSADDIPEDAETAYDIAAE